MDNVLIAEDDHIHLKRLITVLRKYGDKFEVIPANDGQEAIDILKQQSVSLLVGYRHSNASGRRVGPPGLRQRTSPQYTLFCYDCLRHSANEGQAPQGPPPFFPETL